MKGYSKPSRNKIQQIAQMMRDGRKINATLVRKVVGGSSTMIARLFKYGNNQTIIDDYKARTQKLIVVVPAK